MTGLPYPTPTRLRLADAIAARRITRYHFSGETRDTEEKWLCTASVAELVAAGIADYGSPNETGTSLVALTPDGMAWVTRARTADTKITGGGPVSTSPETVPAPAEAPTLTEIVEFLDPDGTLRAESTKDGSE